MDKNTTSEGNMVTQRWLLYDFYPQGKNTDRVFILLSQQVSEGWSESFNQETEKWVQWHLPFSTGRPMPAKSWAESDLTQIPASSTTCNYVSKQATQHPTQFISHSMWHRNGVPYVRFLSTALLSQISVHYLPPGPLRLGGKPRRPANTSLVQ